MQEICNSIVLINNGVSLLALTHQNTCLDNLGVKAAAIGHLIAEETPKNTWKLCIFVLSSFSSHGASQHGKASHVNCSMAQVVSFITSVGWLFNLCDKEHVWLS